MLKDYITYWLIDDYREELIRNEFIIEDDGTNWKEEGYYWFDEWNLWVHIENVNMYFEEVRNNLSSQHAEKGYTY